MACLGFATLCALVCGVCIASSTCAHPNCTQPPSEAQIHFTKEVWMIPRDMARTLENPLRPGATDPLLMLTFGDSALWGNGLAADSKYANMVAQDVADATGRIVHLVTYSHSGANISRNEGECLAPVRDSDDGIPPGDLSAGLPTVTQQESAAALQKDYLGAEIILLNGCINDVSPILIGLPLGGLEAGEIKRRTHRWCSEPILQLLRKTMEDFTLSTIVVANYWLIVSDQSTVLGKSGGSVDALSER